jgi:hypothetical protein
MIGQEFGWISYLLRRNIEGDGSKVYFGVSVDAGNDEEDTGTSRSSGHQSTQSEYDGSFVLLYHLNQSTVINGNCNKSSKIKAIQFE